MTGLQAAFIPTDTEDVEYDAETIAQAILRPLPGLISPIVVEEEETVESDAACEAAEQEEEVVAVPEVEIEIPEVEPVPESCAETEEVISAVAPVLELAAPGQASAVDLSQNVLVPLLEITA